ncbi:adenosylhomocysteinase [Neptuniibacter halophilus]|uniref:adenosylhomocysteinase n=1 Tax=Neptuniibacter halophilus TaxID=651666 RepID=UPI002572DDED|nr:adenosylhomocysteinase [Neptuniibacter halophilus]
MNPLFLKGRHFFEDLNSEPRSELNLVVVTHLLGTAPAYLEALQGFARIALILPKPRSINPQVLETIEQRFPVQLKKRAQIESVEVLAAIINDAVTEGDLILVDIGGYFAAAIGALPERLRARLRGVVEVTENGLKRYQVLSDLPVPVVSIARSPLKGPEDYLTGQSIVYSAEALMRECQQIMNGGYAVVFGYGKIGRSIAKALHAKNINTKIVEIDPVRAIEARSRGFDLISKERALERSDVIFCATGNQSLSNHDFTRIKNGAFLFSVTSSDDELDLSRAEGCFEQTPVSAHITRYQRLGQYFYLANRGNAINFIHQAEVGPYIFLVQGEVIKAINYLQREALTNAIQELPDSIRQELAQSWLSHFA